MLAVCDAQAPSSVAARATGPRVLNGRVMQGRISLSGGILKGFTVGVATFRTRSGKKAA
jgi:hypothetical protein